MKMNAYIAGVGMTNFGKHMTTTLKGLAGQAITAAVADAGLSLSDLQCAYMANGAGGVIQGQEMISGQVALRELGVGKIPVINVENACATSSTAFNQACAMVTGGMYDTVLVCGFEKLIHEDKMRTFAAFEGAVDIENPDGAMDTLRSLSALAGVPVEEDRSMRSVFMDIYSLMAKGYMKEYGATREQFAAVTAKNSFHGSLNSRAQFRKVMTVEEVLAAREIVDPLTLPMCSPIGDGAAAVIVVSERKAKEMALSNPVKVLSSALATGWDHGGEDSLGTFTAQQAYEAASIGPDELSLVELHDASAPSEIMAYEYLGLCGKGAGSQFLEEGHTRLGGRVPVNVSGGLLRKGHPIGATGTAQIVELTEQLRGTSGKRQVEGARFGLAHNGGGLIGVDAAVTVVSILGREK